MYHRGLMALAIDPLRFTYEQVENGQQKDTAYLEALHCTLSDERILVRTNHGTLSEAKAAGQGCLLMTFPVVWCHYVVTPLLLRPNLF